MKQANNTLVTIIICLFFLLAQSCFLRRSQVSLTPPDKRPVYSVTVEDGTEAAILQQSLGLEIVKMEGNRLYYYDVNAAHTERLKQAGYLQINSEEQQQVYKKYVKLRLPKSTDTSYKELDTELRMQQVQVINREKDHWVIYGTLQALSTLKSAGNILQKLDYELRPREVNIYVNAVEDVQKISALGIDIFNTERLKTDRSIVIHGSAYDYQVDSARALNFPVTIVKQRL